MAYEDNLEQYLKLNADYYKKIEICDKCGDSVKYLGLGKYECISCGNIMLNEYAKVREFIDDNKNSYSISEIANRTGVSLARIKELIREGKFDTVERVRYCQHCHKPIEKGELCAECTILKLNNAFEDKPKKQGFMTEANDTMNGEMRFIHRKKK